MKITIELQDGSIAAGLTPQVAVSEHALTSGGGAPAALTNALGVATEADEPAHDGGAPPDWLIDAVNQAAAGDEDGMNVNTTAGSATTDGPADGGPAATADERSS